VKWVQVNLAQPHIIYMVKLIPARPTDFPDTPGFGFPPRFKVEASVEPSFKSPIPLLDNTTADFPNPGDSPVPIDAKRIQAQYIRVTATRIWPRTNDYVFALGELVIMSGRKNVALGAKVTSLDSIEAGRWSTKYLVDNSSSRYSLPDLSDPMVAEAEQKRDTIQFNISEAVVERQKLKAALIGAELRRDFTQSLRDVTDLQKQIKELPSPEVVYAAVPLELKPINVLKRGEIEQPAEEVGPGALSCVESLNADLSADSRSKIQSPKLAEGTRRAALAEWIADPRNPLTWRSIVNRVWHYHFGKGLVDTPNDFGRNGSLPSHPELLDWLAATFRESQSLKRLHKLIVMSAAYQQSSAINPVYAKVDGDNRLLWRMNRQRLDAEEVRDSILAVSGNLDLTMGGPGFELFRFKDDHSPIYDHGAIDKINDPKTWRRTIYRFTVRSVPNPLMECLDCADPSINTPVRNTTLTALQALALLNDPFVVKQAECFAARVECEAGPSPASWLVRACTLAFGRPPSQSELPALTCYVRKHGLVNACRLLLNTNEFVFVD
jgi:hypothetical protein